MISISTISLSRQASMTPKPTYKKFTGYSPGVAFIGDHIVGIENRDGNTKLSVSANRIRLKGSLQGLKTTVSI